MSTGIARARRASLTLLSVLAAAIVVACGGDEPAPPPTNTPDVPTPTVAPSTPTPAPALQLTQSCENAQAGFVVWYPEGWETAAEDGACRYFAPGPLELPGPEAVSAIELVLDDQGYSEVVRQTADSQTLEVLFEEPTEVDGREATLFETATKGGSESPPLPSGTRAYRYVIDADGGALVAVAYALPDADYAESQRVLDAMVRTLELRAPADDFDVSLTEVVDKQRGLPAGYAPDDIVPVPAEYEAPGFTEQAVRSVALEPLIAMLEAAREDGHDIRVRSSYRSYDLQVWTFQYWIDQLGEAEARRVSAPPGHSEHQLGTTVDVATAEVAWDLSESLGDTEAGQWLVENAPRFGFALSYARDTEQITGYKYEPWHWRYIGVEHATAWAESGLTLVEYLEGLPTPASAG